MEIPTNDERAFRVRQSRLVSVSLGCGVNHGIPPFKSVTKNKKLPEWTRVGYE